MAKRRIAKKKRKEVKIEENLKQFFPETSRMGVGLNTPWETQRTVSRRDRPKPPKLQLPRVAVYKPM
jgi:hypothetical protein